jgi:hypothetical protein
MAPPDNFCTQEPGTQTFLPGQYTLRIFDVEDRGGHLLYFQAATAFPSFHSGDKMKTMVWPLKQEGRNAVVEEVYHSIYSIGDQVLCDTYVYCRFDYAKKP